MTEPEANAVQVRINRSLCRAAGECVARAPAAFAIGCDEKAQLIKGQRESEGAIVAAALSCPHFAISVRRDGRKLA